MKDRLQSKRWGIIPALTTVILSLLLLGCEDITPTMASARSAVEEESTHPSPTPSVDRERIALPAATEPESPATYKAATSIHEFDPPTTPPAGTIATPTGISATYSGTSVTVTWDAVTSATHYDVKWYRTGGSWDTATTASNLTETSYSVPLDMTAWYYFQVRAISRVSKKDTSLQPTDLPVNTAPRYSSWSSTESVYATQLPEIPTGVSGTVAGNTITVTWTAVSGATTYERRLRRTSPLPDDVGEPAEVSGTTTSFDVTGGATYAVDIRSKNVAGTSDWATVTDLHVPLSTPTGLHVTPRDGQVTVTWDAVEGASNYEVSYRIVEGTQSRASRTVSVGSGWEIVITIKSPVIIRNLQMGKTYEFRVRARSLVAASRDTTIIYSELSLGVQSTIPRGIVYGAPTQSVPEDYQIQTCIVYEIYTWGRDGLYVGETCDTGPDIKSLTELKDFRYPSPKKNYDMSTFTRAYRFWSGVPNEWTSGNKATFIHRNKRAIECLEQRRIGEYQFELLGNEHAGRCPLTGVPRLAILMRSNAVIGPPSPRPISRPEPDDDDDPPSSSDPPGSSDPSDPPDRYCPITNTWIPESECDDASDTDDDDPPSSSDPPGSSDPSDPPDRYCPITNTWIPESECDDASQGNDE